MGLAEHNKLQLIWVPGQKIIAGSETANLLAPRWSCKRGALRDHLQHLKSITGLRKAKFFIPGPLLNKTGGLL
jgi:hypothetical protein